MQGCAPYVSREQLKREELFYREENVSEHSDAMKVSLAAGLTGYYAKNNKYIPLYDVYLSGDQLQELHMNSGVPMPVANLDSLIFASSSAIDILSGDPAGAAIGIMLTLFSLGGIGGEYAAAKNSELVWMPLNFARGYRDARRKLNNLIMDAYSKSLPDKYKVIHKGNLRLEISGGECSVDNRMCDVFFRCRDEPIVTKTTPDWMAHQSRSYHWGPLSHCDFSQVVLYNSGGDSLKFLSIMKADDDYLRISENLPSWVYFYRAANEKRKYPIIINGGKVLMFIKPNSLMPNEVVTRKINSKEALNN